MKEDILEQIVDAYLNLHGYFTLANVKFKPTPGCKGYLPKQDSVPSDIDILGYNPTQNGPERVVAVSCKSWQAGFEPKWELETIKANGQYARRERWRAFRELANDKWAEAFKLRINELTGATEFVYWTACLFVPKPAEIALWTGEKTFQDRLTPHLRLITLQDMLSEIGPKLTTTLASSHVGRLIQVMKAANLLDNLNPGKTLRVLPTGGA